jgi:hypothetical protein
MICFTGKIPYVSQAEARTVIRNSQSSKRKGVNGGMEAYRCQHCGYWHLGRKKKWKKFRGEQL